MYVTETDSYKKLKYVLRKPADFKPNGKYPIIIFLHGAGGRGDDIDKIATNPFFVESERFDNNAVVFAPQCYADSWFDIFEQLQEFIEYAINSEFCDRARVYMVGASMGGYATWQMAMSHPEWFAAIVPVCGGGMYWNAGRLKNVAVWAFHGDEDPVVYCEESRKMVDAVNKCGGDARLTVCCGVGHNSWINAYTCGEMYDWLLSKRVYGAAPEADGFDNSKQYG